MKKLHYSWVICACGTLILLCNNGLTGNILPTFLPFIEEKGYSGTQGSSLVTLRCLSGIFGMLIVAKFYERISLRKGLTFCALLVTLAFSIMGMAQNYTMYCIGAIIAGLSYSLGAMVPVSLLMSRWFTQKRATALGICSAGTGISSMVFPPLVTAVAERYALSYAFGVLAVFGILTAVLTLLFLRDTPSEKNLRPYGEEQSVEGQSKGQEKQRQNLSRTLYRVMFADMILLGGLSVATSSHYSVLFTSCGHPKSTAAFCISIFGFCLMMGKFVYGAVADRMGAKQATLLFTVLLSLGCASCCLSAQHAVFMYAGSILMGVGFPPATVGISLWAEDFSTPETYGQVLRNFQLSYVTGSMLFASVPGMLYDWSGSYVGFYVLATALFVLFIAVLMGVYAKHQSVLSKK